MRGDSRPEMPMIRTYSSCYTFLQHPTVLLSLFLDSGGSAHAKGTTATHLVAGTQSSPATAQMYMVAAPVQGHPARTPEAGTPLVDLRNVYYSSLKDLIATCWLSSGFPSAPSLGLAVFV